MTFDEFITKYTKLKNTLPRSPTHSLRCENSELTAYSYDCKNCSQCFDIHASRNCLYCFDCSRCSDLIDCDFCYDSEMLYAGVDCSKVYNSAFMETSASTYDSYFCYDCTDCHDIFGCAHLSHKQYCIFNRQYTKEEYEIKVKNLLSDPVEENLDKLKNLINKHPLGPTNVVASQNSDYGNHMFNSTNCYLCFDSANSENCGYLYDSGNCKYSYDLSQCGKAELCYECSDSGQIYNCDHLDWSGDCYDSSYLSDCKDCHNCFGCVGVAHKRFCILNHQYTEEQYNKIVEEIRATAH